MKGTTFLITLLTAVAFGSADPNEKCPAVFDPDNQVFLPHDDCTKYYICTEEAAAIEMTCPKGLHWNQQLHICDWPDQANCTPSIPSKSTSSSDECPASYDPNHPVYFPHADCTKFYICDPEGTKLEQDCPAGFHWNQDLSYCDFFGEIPCVQTKEGQEPECPITGEDDPPAFLPHEDCTRYYVCDNGSPIAMVCPPGLFWNAVWNTCDQPENSECVQES